MNQFTGGVVIIFLIVVAVFSFFLIKKKNSYAYIMLYLFTWVGFGCFYWLIATYSRNDVFIFEEHIKLNSMSKLIYKNLDSIYELEDIKNVLKSDSHKLQAVNLEAGYNRQIAFCDRHIGESWADLYMNYYHKRGYTHYSYKLLEAEEDPKELLYFKPIEETIFVSEFYNPTTLYKYQITLYKSSENLKRDQFADLAASNQMEALETIFVWSTKKINKLVKDDINVFYTPIDYGLAPILAFSFSMPDQSIWNFKEVELGEVPYPIIDFLYFSAVTLTTLGYGDILPNSSLTRAFVMIETLLGLILIGIFISKILENETTHSIEAQIKKMDENIK